MIKKVLTGLLGVSCLCLPLGNVNVFASATGTSDVTMNITGGDAGWSDSTDFASQTMNLNIELNQSDTTGTLRTFNDKQMGFGIKDLTGTHSGWEVSVSTSDFIYQVGGNVQDRISEHNGLFYVQCGTQNEHYNNYRKQPHVNCKTDITVPITSSGTNSVTLLSAPANSTSAGIFWYDLPENFFGFSFSHDLRAGTYNGEVTFEFTKAP